MCINQHGPFHEHRAFRCTVDSLRVYHEGLQPIQMREARSWEEPAPPTAAVEDLLKFVLDTRHSV